MKSDVWTNFVQTSDFTVKALMISNSLYDRNFQKKTDIKVKICFYAKLCTQNKILASKCEISNNKRLPFSHSYLEKMDYLVASYLDL